MDERKNKSSDIKNKRPKPVGNNVLSAEDRFASIRPFKAEETQHKTDNNGEKTVQASGTSKKKAADTVKVSKAQRERFLSDDDDFSFEEIQEQGTEKNNPKAETAAKNGRVIGEISSKPKKKRKKKKKKKAQIPSAVVFVAVAVVLILVLCFFLLRVANVNIEGNVRKTDEEIIALSGIESGDHMWFFSTKTAAKQIESDPYIQFSTVERSYPNTVNITVSERAAAAVIQSVSAYAVIDASGYVLSIDDASSYNDIMSVSGMGASGYKVGTYLGDENDFMARTLLSILDAMKQSGIKDEVKSLDISNPMSIEMVMKSGISVHMGQSDDAQKKFEKLALVLPWLNQNGYTDGTVDISVQGDPVYSPPSTPTPIPTLTPTPTPILSETPDDLTEEPQFTDSPGE